MKTTRLAGFASPDALLRVFKLFFGFFGFFGLFDFSRLFLAIENQQSLVGQLLIGGLLFCKRLIEQRYDIVLRKFLRERSGIAVARDFKVLGLLAGYSIVARS